MPEKKKTTTTRTTRTARTTAAAQRTTRRAPARKAAVVKPTKGATPATPAAWKRSRRRTLVGIVVADRTPKTVVVEVGRQRSHPLYKKVIRLRKRFPTHDPNEEAKLGDLVRIEESRPFSATKRFRIAEIISRAGEARAAAAEVADVEAALEQAEGVSLVVGRGTEEGADTEEEKRS